MNTEASFICLRCKGSDRKPEHFKTFNYEVIEKTGRFRLATRHTCGTTCSKFIKRELAEEIRKAG